MISFEEARRIAEAKIGPLCGLVEESILEKPYGWHFFYQSKEYLESGRLETQLVGSGGFIVDRAKGRVFEFGSGHALDRNLEAYEAGFNHIGGDIIVLEVYDRERSTDFLLRLGPQQTTPETAYGVEWRVPRPLTKLEIQSALGVCLPSSS